MDAIKPVAEEWEITEKKLPKNMTGKLQVMDIMVNVLGGSTEAGKVSTSQVKLIRLNESYYMSHSILRLGKVLL